VEVAPRTHQGLDRRLCGTPVALADGTARVELEATAEMAADALGLVHGGFVFGLADHAAMLAVDEPTVVLAGAETRFLAPVRVGELLVAEAAVLPPPGGRRRTVEVAVRRGGETVMTGVFHAVVLDRHVLSR
jgi:acyl-coenzyme A thioesterase PaaI-like protein